MGVFDRFFEMAAASECFLWYSLFIYNAAHLVPLFFCYYHFANFLLLIPLQPLDLLLFYLQMHWIPRLTTIAHSIYFDFLFFLLFTHLNLYFILNYFDFKLRCFLHFVNCYLNNFHLNIKYYFLVVRMNYLIIIGFIIEYILNHVSLFDLNLN